MSLQRPATRTWSFPRPMIEDTFVLVLVHWAVFIIGVTGVALGIAWFGDLTQSILDHASGIALWALAVLVGVLVYVYLPLYLANGRTRKSAAIEGGIYLAFYSIVGAALMTVAHLIEEVVFRIGGWPTELQRDHLFSSHVQSHLVFGEYLIQFLFWLFAGALVGVGFYRSDGLGLSLMTLIFFIGSVITSLLDWTISPLRYFIVELLDIGTLSISEGLVLNIVALLVSAGVGWFIVRDIPMQTKSG